MTWCPRCAQNTETHRDFATGNIFCVDCGEVVSQDIYAEDDTFVKDAAGGAHLAGNLVKLQSAYSESHQRTLNKGNDVIHELIGKYGISKVDHATKYYQIAVERGFTRGRRTGQVAAACLYVACREMDKPFLLIEFSSELGVSVYELGIVYLQLCKLLSLQEHPFVQKPVDPSLFVHRYISGTTYVISKYTRPKIRSLPHGLMKDGNSKNVLNTALHLVVSMKRDWIQTGRKPSGICAAAIYVSSLLHGYNFSKADVVKSVHICEATLTKRLIEFENTEAASLTIEEFTQNAMDFEKETQSCKQSANDLKMPGMTEVVCQHNSSAVQSGFGLCKDCYMEFCGGLDGSEPPAFQCARVERSSKKPVKRSTESTSQKTAQSENEKQGNAKETCAECVGKLDKTSDGDAFVSSNEPSADESDTLSDIPDSEIDSYLLDKVGSRLKKKIWERQNPEYMQKQAAKEAAAHNLHTENSEETSQVFANKKEKVKRKKNMEATNAKPPQTTSEAACQYFKKRFGSKFNYDALAALFDDGVTTLV